MKVGHMLEEGTDSQLHFPRRCSNRDACWSPAAYLLVSLSPLLCLGREKVIRSTVHRKERVMWIDASSREAAVLPFPLTHCWQSRGQESLKLGW